MHDASQLLNTNQIMIVKLVMIDVADFVFEKLKNVKTWLQS